MANTPNVLIVEDLSFWQDALGEVLVDAGYRVHIAPSYTSALDALTHNDFHLAVIDPVLDDANRRNRDGLRVLQHVLDERPELPMVVVTSSDPKRIRHEVSHMSPNIPVLWKDQWDDDQFLRLVRDLLSRKHKIATGACQT